MILKRLCEAAERFDFPPAGYTEGPIRWLIDLDTGGHLLGFTRMAETDRPTDRGKLMRHPVVARTSGVKAQLLADKADYALGFAPGETAERTAQRQQAFLQVLTRCADETGLPLIRAVIAYTQHHIDPSSFPDDLAAGDIVTFRVDGRILIHEPCVRDHWAATMAEERGERAGEERTCLVCGRTAPIADRHLTKIKRVPGGQTAGCAIVSANSSAFESYGLEAALTAPTCWDCARDYAQVLSEFLGSDRYSFRISDQVAYVFWTREDTELSVATLLSAPQPEEVRELLDSVVDGSRRGSVSAADFYALALSGSGGRVVIRDWLETTVEAAQRNIARYFRAQEIVDPDGQPGEPLKLMALMGALIPSAGRDPWKQLPPNTATAVVHAAVTGGPLPNQLLYRAVSRARTEPDTKELQGRTLRGQKMTRQRAALIKMCLLLSGHSKEGFDVTPEMNPQIEDPAYLCGRLLAVLESIQRAAIPGAKATLVDRYYGTASSAPASVFGNLIRQAQAHMGKLRKTKGGAHYRLQLQLEEIAAKLPQFPNTLTLIDQGKFGLGYYQQKAADRADRDEAVAAKRAEDEDNAGEDASDV
jgi:CRISPR-associated protein Csd1